MVASFAAITIVGCGDAEITALDGGLPDAGASDSGGEVDPFAPIAPTAPPVAGEGDACRFSVECGALQVCVDDVCVRRERLEPSALTWGELRHVPLDEILADRDQTLPHPWSVLREGDVNPRPHASILASRTGATLAFTVDHPTSCPLVFVGATIRTAWLDRLRCTTVGLDATDGMWAAGFDADSGAPVVVRVGADGTEQARHDLAESLDSVIGAATAWGRVAGPVTSMLWFDGSFYMSMRPGRVGDRSVSIVSTDEIEVVFVRLGSDGSVALVDVAGRRVFDGHEAGWLVPNADGSPAALLVQRDVRSFDTPVPLDLLRLSDGTRERWLDDWALDIRPSVWAPGIVDLFFQDHPQCVFTVLRPPARTASSYNREACGAGGGYRVPVRTRDFDAPEPGLPLALEHPVYRMINTQFRMLTADQGVEIQLFGHDLEPARTEWWSRPLDGAYDSITTSAISRHGVTVEGALGFFWSGAAFEWFELAISDGSAE